MNKNYLVSFVVGLFLLQGVHAQNTGISNNWLMGYQNWAGLPYGETKIDFNSGIPLVTVFPIPMDFNHTHANVSDSLGNLLFYTNGYYIADASNDTMQNGSGINPGAYANFAPDGFLIPQAALIIPKPWSNNIYYMFHNTVDAYPIIPNNSTSFYFYVTTVDMNLNSGLGGVVSKNQILISDSMNVGKITACRHANGRDWWVICHRVNSNKFYKFLVTPYGINGPFDQNIGLFRRDDAGQAKFSSDGARFAYYHYFNGLDIFDFDRCTGLFSNPVSDTTLPWITGNVGCEFSPNSNVLYVCNIEKVYQYDLTSANVISSKTVVATYDNFYDVFPSLGTYLCLSQLAPDGKIYLTTGNGTRYFHVINNPDSVGIGCNLVQHSLFIPTYNFNTLPNPPNYFLGKIAGGPCDTVPTNVGIIEPIEIKPKVLPNPTSGVFTLWFAVHAIPGVLEIFDINGSLIYHDFISSWSQYKQVDITNETSAIYFCKLSWGDKVTGVKVIKH